MFYDKQDIEKQTVENCQMLCRDCNWKKGAQG